MAIAKRGIPEKWEKKSSLSKALERKKNNKKEKGSDNYGKSNPRGDEYKRNIHLGL